jgi:manganese/zinc/iron transport system substrate-binding protein
MTRADLVIWHGLYLEAQMEDFFGKLSVRRAVVPVADGLARGQLIEHPNYADKFDPHVWMHPGLWVDVLAIVRDTLMDAMPESAGVLRENADRHMADVRRLDAFGTRVLATIPENNRVLMTAHDAFGYFGRAYGIEVLGIQGISTQSEAGLNRIGQMVDVLVERKIAAVFVESSVSDRNIRALIEGAAAKGHAVRIGGELYSDAMGPIDSYEGTYLGMLDHNITVIAAALGGDVPARGMNDKLTVGM